MLIKTETKPPFRLSHDRRIFIMAFIAGLPGSVIALILIWTGSYTPKVQWTLTVLILGVWLVHHAGYSYGTFWVWAAIVLWVVAAALGGRGGRYQSKAGVEAARLAETGDTMTAELRALVRDPVGNALAYGSGLTLLLILILMIWKPGQ